MRKLLFVALLLAACGRKQPAPRSVPGLSIAITHDGFVKVDGRALTLDELGTLLAARREAAPLEEVAYGAKASPLPVNLDLEDDTLWRHVSWVRTVLAEQKFWRVSLPGGRESPLPFDSGLTRCRPPDGKALLIHVLVFEGGTYALGDRTTDDAARIGTWIDAASRSEALCRIGTIAEQPRVSWRLIRPVCDVLRSRSVDVDFTFAIPAPSERGRSPLPPPRSWVHPMRWSGSFLVDYWASERAWDSPFAEDAEEPTDSESEMAALLDEHRRGLDLPDRESDPALDGAAWSHAQEMSRMNYFSHFSPVPGNRSPSDRLAKFGWPGERRHSELLAKGETAEAAFRAIVAKPENAKVLADPALRYAGVAQAGDCWVVLLGAEP